MLLHLPDTRLPYLVARRSGPMKGAPSRPWLVVASAVELVRVVAEVLAWRAAPAAECSARLERPAVRW